MKGNRAVLTAIVILVIAVAGWWLFRRGGGERDRSAGAVRQREEGRRDRSASNEATLAGDTKRAIAAPPNGRIHFHARIPDDGWLKVSLGMKPEAWTKEGNGVYFFVGVSDGRAFEQLFTQTVNPFANPGRAPVDPGHGRSRRRTPARTWRSSSTRARVGPGQRRRQSQRSAALGRARDRHALIGVRSMRVPLLDLQEQYRPLRDEILAAIARVCDSQRFIGGPEVDALERELRGLPRRRRTPSASRPAPTRCSSR